MTDTPAPHEGATPRPWKVAAKTRIWYAGDDPEIGNVEIAQFGCMSDKALVPFNAKRWQADCALAVAAVNAYDPEREGKVKALVEAARELSEGLAPHSDEPDHMLETTSGFVRANALLVALRAALKAMEV